MLVSLGFFLTVLRLNQCGLRLCKFTLKIHTLVNFMRQSLIDLYHVLSSIADFDFQLVGSLQRMGYITCLHRVRNFLFEHCVDHDQLCRRLLDRVVYSLITVKNLSQCAGSGGRIRF